MLDVAIDGADEVDPDMNLIKGEGGMSEGCNRWVRDGWGMNIMISEGEMNEWELDERGVDEGWMSEGWM